MRRTTLTGRLREDPSTTEARPPAAQGLDSSVDASGLISQDSVQEGQQSTKDKLAELIAAGFINETDAKKSTDEDTDNLTDEDMTKLTDKDIDEIYETFLNSQYTPTHAPVADDLDQLQALRNQAKKLIATDLTSTQAPWKIPPGEPPVDQFTPSRSHTGGSSSSSGSDRRWPRKRGPAIPIRQSGGSSNPTEPSPLRESWTMDEELSKDMSPPTRSPPITSEGSITGLPLVAEPLDETQEAP